MAGQEDFVLDCSVAMAWCFGDEATAYTDGVRDCSADKRAVVPSIWPLEAANATLMGERRKRLDEARSQRFFVLLAALPIVVDDETSSRAVGAIMRLARTQQRSAYDAAYLELASRRGLPPRLRQWQPEKRRSGSWRRSVHASLTPHGKDISC